MRVRLIKSHPMPDGQPVPRRVNHVGGRKLQDRIEWGGLSISVEHQPGSLRRWGPGPDDVVRMKHAYGYIRGSVGADGEHHDVFVGTGEPSDCPTVYIFDTFKSPSYETFDEQKTMLGFASSKAARRALEAHYSDADKRIGQCRSMPLSVFRHKVLRTTEERPLVRSYRIVKAGGPYIGPRGGKYADPEHNIPWEIPLAQTLHRPGKHPAIGAERGKAKDNGIGKHVSPHGSTRYLYYENGRVVSGLQVMSRDGKQAKVANVYTHESHRRKGLAKQLLDRARKDFDHVEHADEQHLSEEGRQWRDAVKSLRPYRLVKAAPSPVGGGGPYIGPKGGKWADAQHTVHWVPLSPRERLQQKIRRRPPGQGAHVLLTKNELKSVLDTGKFALVSAGPNPNLPADKDMSPEQARQRHNELRRKLVASGYMFTQVEGHYGGREDSFLVMVHDAERKEVRELGETFHQDSVIYAQNGQNELHFTTGDNANQNLCAEGKGWQELPDASDYYTKFPHPGGGHTKFSLNFDFDHLTQCKKSLRVRLVKAGGPYIGPRGGKWADAKHTIPWEGQHERVLFHSAPAYAIESIQEHGLVPRQGAGLFEHGGYDVQSQGKVFLSDNFSAANQWYGKVEGMLIHHHDDESKHDVVMLRVKHRRTERDPVGEHDVKGSRFTKRTIPPDDIEYHDKEHGWLPLHRWEEGRHSVPKDEKAARHPGNEAHRILSEQKQADARKQAQQAEADAADKAERERWQSASVEEREAEATKLLQPSKFIPGFNRLTSRMRELLRVDEKGKAIKSFRIVGVDELRKHKYISRKRVGDRWEYEYPDEENERKTPRTGLIPVDHALVKEIAEMILPEKSLQDSKTEGNVLLSSNWDIHEDLGLLVVAKQPGRPDPITKEPAQFSNEDLFDGRKVSGALRTQVDRSGHVQHELHINLPNYVKKDQLEALRAAIRSTVAHELTHHADKGLQLAIRSDKLKPRRAKGDLERHQEYLNQPHEVAASLQQIHRDLIDPKAAAMARNLWKLREKDPDRAQSDSWQRHFANWMYNNSERFADRSAHYTPKNRRRLMNMIWRTFEGLGRGTIEPKEKSFRIVGPDALRKHKYIKRWRVGDHWEYEYPDDAKIEAAPSYRQVSLEVIPHGRKIMREVTKNLKETADKGARYSEEREIRQMPDSDPDKATLKRDWYRRFDAVSEKRQAAKEKLRHFVDTVDQVVEHASGQRGIYDNKQIPSAWHAARRLLREEISDNDFFKGTPHGHFGDVDRRYGPGSANWGKEPPAGGWPLSYDTDEAGKSPADKALARLQRRTRAFLTETEKFLKTKQAEKLPVTEHFEAEGIHFLVSSGSKQVRSLGLLDKYVSKISELKKKMGRRGMAGTLDGLTIHIADKESDRGEWVAGLYQSSNDRLTMFLLGMPEGPSHFSGRSEYGTLVHELGHRLWFKQMDAGARTKWDAQFQSQIAEPHEIDAAIDGVLQDIQSARAVARAKVGDVEEFRDLRLRHETEKELERLGYETTSVRRTDGGSLKEQVWDRIAFNWHVKRPDDLRAEIKSSMIGDKRTASIYDETPPSGVLRSGISSYGNTSSVEAFAEAFRLYVDQGPGALTPFWRQALEDAVATTGQRLRKGEAIRVRLVRL